ncbi:MAG: hypothetical protein A2744_00195 [Candidatus Buchananbacteria bacterium RIFCSPHIGHO2_01_FULL_44_11]|uniref:Uncharacterized protein n=1 Tax=Candidatus Buchananbacteria bacterium RIFCSPHIGHO2_01_FULL_44_11 TaxID=1797535 RepID=A0A1G1Y071_9BACT|nr:MAG: hypothetical protein A2744_00195 [Candidatus Buchananbacteria bacterium RIFCSPHIGHO2_01_FULL_44_11]
MYELLRWLFFIGLIIYLPLLAYTHFNKDSFDKNQAIKILYVYGAICWFILIMMFMYNFVS